MLKNLEVKRAEPVTLPPIENVTFKATGNGKVELRVISNYRKVEIKQEDIYATFNKEDLISYIEILNEIADQLK